MILSFYGFLCHCPAPSSTVFMIIQSQAVIWSQTVVQFLFRRWMQFNLGESPPTHIPAVASGSRRLTDVLAAVWATLSWVNILLGVLKKCGSVLGSRVVLGVAHPALHVVLHPVGPVAVTEQEEVGFLSSQQQTGSCQTQRKYSHLPSFVSAGYLFLLPLLTFVFSLRRAVVAEKPLQHGFLWAPGLNGLLLHQPQKASSLVCPG